MIGSWFAPFSQPSAHDTAAVAGMVEEAASHENRSFAVTRPAEWHIFTLGFRVSMVVCIVGGEKGNLRLLQKAQAIVLFVTVTMTVTEMIICRQL